LILAKKALFPQKAEKGLYHEKTHFL